MLGIRERRQRKRDARPKTLVRRGDLPTASPPVVVSRAFLRRLKRHDSRLELVWSPVAETFLLYTRARGEGQPNDLMVLELDLGKKPPGGWLIEWLKFNDKYAGGAINPREASKNYLEKFEKDADDWVNYWDKLRLTMSEDVAKHLKWCIDGRQSFTVDWGRRRYI